MMLRGLLSERYDLGARSICCFLAMAALLVASCSNPEEDEASPNGISPLAGYQIIDGIPTLMGPSVIYEGIWLSELEGSQFFENETRIRKLYDDIYFDKWLELRIKQPDFPPVSPSTEYQSNYGSNSANFAWVKFVGRRNLFPGPYGFGHLGTSKNIVVVQKVISAKPLSR